MLFSLAHWHGVAKLRMHTDTTLAILDANTTILGKRLRHFKQKTCFKYPTRELTREQNARMRKRVQSATASGADTNVASGRQPKSLNLNVSKLHAMGDYVATVKRLGTTDSYSTQLVSLLHPRNADG